MPAKTKQHEQFIVLMAGDISYSSLKHSRQNIIAANKHDDILMHIATTQFNLILVELTANSSVVSAPDRLQRLHPWQRELISRIKDPLCINNKTPVIAIINPEEGSQEEAQSPLGEFDGSLIKPITEEQLDKIINLWQTKALAYIQIILSKTKNNQRLALTIAEKLFEELPLQIIAIKNALENKHYDLAQEITHKLNGSVSFCGLMDIQQPAKALESCLLNNHYAAMNQHFSRLQQHTLNFTRHQESTLTGLGEMQLP